MLDYKLLEALARVVSEQGFDKAARNLCITQSVVSQRVKTLEDQTGQILVTRKVPPKPTREGSRLIKHYLQVKTLEAQLNASGAGQVQNELTRFSIGINADSLATWFFDAVDSTIKKYGILLDLKIDDQDETHKMLKNGEVAGCISSEGIPVQGCRVTFIGTMNYRLAATVLFAEKYGLQPLTRKAFSKTPAVIFNRKDCLHHQFFRRYFNAELPKIPVSYIPSSESFARAIIDGIAYGLIPDLQGKKHIETGELVDLAPDCHIQVKLYWHCWNINSELLAALSDAIVNQSKIC